MRTVGMIGVGVMGSAMAHHLVDAGYRVLGFDVEPSRLVGLARRGGTAAVSCRQVAEEADLVVTSLPSVAAFEQVVAEVAGSAPRGLAVADTSTLFPEVKERGRETLAAQGVTLLDCTLSGTGGQAQTKDVVVYASGDRGAVEQFGPVFEAFSRAWHHVGEFGSGSKVKVIANLLVAIHNVAAAEALVLAGKAGLDLAAVVELIGDGAGTSRMFEVRGPSMASGDYGVGIRTRTFQKDVEIISAFAREHGCAVPLFAAAAQLYSAAVGQGLGDQDTACVFTVLAGMAGLPEDGHGDGQGDGHGDGVQTVT